MGPGGVQAGEGGFEPPHTDPESAVLPLDDSPMRSGKRASDYSKGIRIWQKEIAMSAARAMVFQPPGVAVQSRHVDGVRSLH